MDEEEEGTNDLPLSLLTTAKSISRVQQGRKLHRIASTPVKLDPIGPPSLQQITERFSSKLRRRVNAQVDLITSFSQYQHHLHNASQAVRTVASLLNEVVVDFDIDHVDAVCSLPFRHSFAEMNQYFREIGSFLSCLSEDMENSSLQQQTEAFLDHLAEFKEVYDNQIEDANLQVKKAEEETSRLAKKKKPNLDKLCDALKKLTDHVRLVEGLRKEKMTKAIKEQESNLKTIRSILLHHMKKESFLLRKKFYSGIVDQLERCSASVEEIIHSASGKPVEEPSIKIKTKSASGKSFVSSINDFCLYPVPNDSQLPNELVKMREKTMAKPSELLLEKLSLGNLESNHRRKKSFEDALKEDIISLMEKSAKENDKARFTFGPK